MARVLSVGPHDVFLLDEWGRQLWEAFGARAYLVGSVARAEPHYRDVDVRMPIDDAEWAAFDRPVAHPSRLEVLNLAMSLWGRHVTGLPIDFQFQSKAEWDEHRTEVVNPIGTRSQSKWRSVASEKRAVRLQSNEPGEERE